MNTKKTSLIAEIGSVHDGSYGNAIQLIISAAECGADAVKFQTHIADCETLPDAPNPSYFSSEPRYDYFNRTSFSKKQWNEIKEVCDQNSVEFLSSPFSIEAVEFLESLNITKYKIPSGEVTNLPMLEIISKIGKPVLISSGMSSWHELDRAIKVLERGCSDITVMQCSSIYPCPPEKVGLNVMLEMKNRYGLPVGFSDHTLGSSACLAAVTLGAHVIEKHFTFSRRMYGSDAQHSMEPNEFKILSDSIGEINAIINNPVNKENCIEYTEMKSIFEKSIVTAKFIPEGNKITMSDLCFKKPGTGINAGKYEEILGRTVKRNIAESTLLNFNDLV